MDSCLFNWQKCHRLQKQLSELEIDWLFGEGSLTQRLTLLSNHHFSLAVLSEKETYLREDEYVYLNIASSRKERVREVVLKGHNEPWVYARSVIIPDDKTSDTLIDIGQKPLGAILFTSNHFQRSELEAASYPIHLMPSLYRYDNL
ncbi:chorismate--pyruvate lyase family protein [Commensalibacter intestini]|nr:chorismate lyase [Commensalibacter intestini]